MGSGKKYLDTEEERLIIRSANNQKSQKWIFDKTSKTIMSLETKGQSIDMGRLAGNEADLELSQTEANYKQMWRYENEQLININSKRVFSVKGNLDEEGNTVEGRVNSQHKWNVKYVNEDDEGLHEEKIQSVSQYNIDTLQLQKTVHAPISIKFDLVVCSQDDQYIIAKSGKGGKIEAHRNQFFLWKTATESLLDKFQLKNAGKIGFCFNNELVWMLVDEDIKNIDTFKQSLMIYSIKDVKVIQTFNLRSDNYIQDIIFDSKDNTKLFIVTEKGLYEQTMFNMVQQE